MDKGVVYLEKRLLGGEVRVPGTECLLKSMVSEKTAERNNRKKRRGEKETKKSRRWSLQVKYGLVIVDIT